MMHRFWSKARAYGRVFGLIVIVTWPSSRAFAATEPTTDALVEQGLEQRRARQDEAALATFERAYQGAAKPMILAQIGLAEQALGRFLAAEQHLTESLASRDPWIEQHRAALERALSVVASRLSWLEVTVSSSDVELRVDDQPRALAESPFRLTAGSHTVELRSRSGTVLRRAVELRPGTRLVYQLELPETTATATAPSPPPLPPPPARAPTPSPPRAEPGSRARTWAYVTATLTGLALVEAVAASLVRQGFVDDYNGPECAPDRSERCAAYRRSANTFGAVATVGYVVAGAAGLTSVTLFTEPWWGRSGAPESAVVGISGRF